MDKLQRLIDKSIANKYLFGISLCVRQKGETWQGSSGNFLEEEPFFIASTTKLFISSLVFKLREKGKLDFEDSIAKFLAKDVIHHLHRHRGNDYSEKITVANLLGHTSGLPDYFQNRPSSGRSLESRLTGGEDLYWDFRQVLEWSKAMKPKFPPSQKGRAHYSDTNFQLLGRILENLYELDLGQVIQSEICAGLGMKNTYLYTDITDRRPKELYFKSKPLHIPKAMTSFGPDGGMVSTAGEMMTFLTAFMTGQLFPVSYLSEIKDWKRIFFPLESGMGIHRFKTPWFFSPFRRMPEMIGHSGLSGAFAFHVPREDIYLTGTVNQIHNPGNSFRLMVQMMNELLVKSTR